MQRHINVVYSTALRSTGNSHAAEEITQAVFIILARKANKLSRKIVLSGWLYQTTRLTAANFLRTEIRRQKREQEAFMQSTLNEPEPEVWRQIAPLLDDAISRFGEKDRNAVVLRFFENKNLREVGAALGASEDAAKMRVNRALEKLRKFFTKRGVSSTTAIIAGAISTNSVQAAPVGLAQTISAVAIAKGAAAGGSTLALVKGALKIMAWTKAKTAVVIGVTAILATTSTTVVGIKLARAHHATAKPPAGLSPIMVSVTGNIQTDGAIHVQATVEETNSSGRAILTDNLGNEEGSIIRLTDEFGQAMKFTRQGRRGYLITLNKAVPPRSNVSYTVEEGLAADVVRAAGVIKTTVSGIHEFRMTSYPGNDRDMRYIEVWRLPPEATLLDKDMDVNAVTNDGQIELQFDKIIPPNGNVQYGFRYRLAAN